MPVLILLLFLAACASSSERERHATAKRWPELAARPDRVADKDLAIFAARHPDPEQAAQLDRAIRIYLEDGDEAFATERERLAQNQVTAFWLARTLGLFAVEALSRAGQAGLQVAGEPAWARPIRNLVAMAASAVPFVVIDLLDQGLSDRRDLGKQILVEMGPEVLPAWSFILESSDLRLRRVGMQILADLPPSSLALPCLEKGARDPDFGIRASAYRGLGKAGEQWAPRMREALQSEADQFVRKAIIEAMANYRDRASLEAVVAYLETSLRNGEFDEMRRADRLLQEMSGQRGSRDPAAWRAWIRSAFDGS